MEVSEVVTMAVAAIISGAVSKLWGDVSKLKTAMAAQEAIVPRIEARLLEIVQELRALRAEMVREYDHNK
jgi:glycerol kinase